MPIFPSQAAPQTDDFQAPLDTAAAKTSLLFRKSWTLLAQNKLFRRRDKMTRSAFENEQLAFYKGLKEQMKPILLDELNLTKAEILKNNQRRKALQAPQPKKKTKEKEVKKQEQMQERPKQKLPEEREGEEDVSVDLASLYDMQQMSDSESEEV